MKLKRGTTIPQTFRLRLADRTPARLSGLPATATVTVICVRVADASELEQAVDVIETTDSGGIVTDQGKVSVALAADPAMPVGVWRCRFKVVYPDSREEFFPSDEDLDLVVTP